MVPRRTLLLAIALLANVLGTLLVLANHKGSSPAWATCSAQRAHDLDPAAVVEPPAALELELVAELDQPTAVAPLADGSLLVSLREQGVVHLSVDGQQTTELDLTRDLSVEAERGVLGLALQPDGQAFFVSYTAKDGAFTLARYAVGGAASPRDERDGQVVLSYPDDHPFHNGGHLDFGPDEMLYVSLGDGGDDYPGDPEDDAQALDSLFGKILRLDVLSSPGEYVAPEDNPFVDDRGAHPEIWAYGMRNAWRFSFDAATGDMWVADVGHFCWEEVDVIPEGNAGANLGWNRFEGTHEFRPRSEPLADLVWPVYEYRHVPGPQGGEIEGDRPLCAIIGGPVYRGNQVPELQGWYVYSDVCSGAVFGLRVETGGDAIIAELAEVPIETAVLSLAEDASGAILVLTGGGIFRLVPA